MGEAANQIFADAGAHLAAELDWLDGLLARHVAHLRATGAFTEDPFRGLFIEAAQIDAALASGPTETGGAIDARRERLDLREAASLAAGVALPLPSLARAFGLDAFERAVLLIAAAPSLDRRYGLLFGYANNDATRKGPTVDLALQLLTGRRPGRHGGLGAFSEAGRLFRHGLVLWAAGAAEQPLAERCLAAPDDVALALAGCAQMPDFVRLASSGSAASDAAADPALRAEAEAAFRLADAGPMVALVAGRRDSGEIAAIAAAAEDAGRPLLVVALDHPAARAMSGQALGRMLSRIALPAQAALALRPGFDVSAARVEEVAVAAACRGLALFVPPGEEPVAAARLRGVAEVMALRLAPASAARRAGWWRQTAGEAEAAILARRFRHGPEAIAAIARLSRTQAGGISEAARRISDGSMPALARHVQPRWRWDDLVLPGRILKRLREIARSMRAAPQVEDGWGLQRPAGPDSGQIALFAGPSGTGKTMAASLIAHDAGLDLYRVELSAIFDKYIGETEKHLDRLFDAAGAAGAALLFDEAEVLFGRRMEAKDSHDRYANLSVAYLLQRIESHPGLVMLASNMGETLDKAFARRIQHQVTFPPPDAALRFRLWRASLPEAGLSEGVDLAEIAGRFELTGGAIRSAGYAAACRAAADGRMIARGDILQAVAREYDKLGRPPSAADFGADLEDFAPDTDGRP